MTDDALEDLDASVRRTDPDRWLASRFIADAAQRSDVIALYAFDHELSRALGMKDALMSEIRLTWWGEVLGEIFEGRPVRRHPVALALAEAVQRRSLPRDLLEKLIDPRFDLIGEAAHASEDTETALMTLAIRALGGDHEPAARAAAAVRFGALSRRASDPDVSRLPAAAFPAIAYASVGRDAQELSARIRLTWAVLRGRL